MRIYSTETFQTSLSMVLHWSIFWTSSNMYITVNGWKLKNLIYSHNIYLLALRGKMSKNENNTIMSFFNYFRRNITSVQPNAKPQCNFNLEFFLVLTLFNIWLLMINNTINIFHLYENHFIIICHTEFLCTSLKNWRNLEFVAIWLSLGYRAVCF